MKAEIICQPYLTLYIFKSIFHRLFSSISAMLKYWNDSGCLIFCSKIHLIAGIFRNAQKQRSLFHGMVVQLPQIVFLFQVCDNTKNKRFLSHDEYHEIAYLNIGLLLTFVIISNQLHNTKRCKHRFLNNTHSVYIF